VLLTASGAAGGAAVGTVIGDRTVIATTPSGITVVKGAEDEVILPQFLASLYELISDKANESIVFGYAYSKSLLKPPVPNNHGSTTQT
jgi:hypothetical protein